MDKRVEAAQVLVKLAKQLIASDKFLNSYIETALWSSTDDDDEPMNKNYDKSDIAPEALRKMEQDCEKFKHEASKEMEDLDDKQVGHDFWLTRNRHGAGFWDGDYEKEVGDKLTKISHSFGEQDLYVGDDGKLYV